MNPIPNFRKQDYIKKRFMGQKPDAIKKEYVQERKDQVGASANNVVQQLLNNARKAHDSISTFATKVEQLDCITPAKKQLKILQETHTSLQKIYDDVKENQQLAQAELEKQAAQRDKLRQRLADVQRQIKAQPEKFRFAEPANKRR